MDVKLWGSLMQAGSSRTLSQREMNHVINVISMSLQKQVLN